MGRTRAENHPDDVAVVQGLLLYLPPHVRGFAKGKWPARPNGAIDEATRWAIEEYQKYVNNCPHKPKKIQKINEDGRICSARGKYYFGRNTYMWTITSLNFDALEVSLLEGHLEGYIKRICSMFPEVKAALKIA